MKKNKKLYEGKGKKIYLTDEADQLIQEFKDDAAALESSKRGTIKGKGVINNQISAHLFRYLDSYHIPTHFIKKLSDTQMLVKKLDIIPFRQCRYCLIDTSFIPKSNPAILKLPSFIRIIL